MKSWKPPTGKVVRPRFGAGKRLRSLDEFVQPVRTSWFSASGPRPTLPSYLRVGGAPGRSSLPDGAKAGLVLIAAACIGIAIGAYQAFGPREIVAPEAAAEVANPQD